MISYVDMLCLTHLPSTHTQVVWRSIKGHVVRIPIAVRFSDLAVPEYIKPVQRTPKFDYRYHVGADTATTVSIASEGIVAADVTELELQRTDSTDLDSPGVGKVEITVADGNAYFMVGILGADVDPQADLDLHLYQGSTLIGKSTSDSSTELLEAIDGLPAGVYTAYVYPYFLPAGSTTAYLHVWQLPAASQAVAGTALMRVSPSSIETIPGDMGCCPITLSFSGLDFSDGLLNR